MPPYFNPKSKSVIGITLGLILLTDIVLTLMGVLFARYFMEVGTRHGFMSLLAAFAIVETVVIFIRHREHAFRFGFNFNYCKNQIDKLDLPIMIQVIFGKGLIYGFVTACLEKFIS